MREAGIERVRACYLDGGVTMKYIIRYCKKDNEIWKFTVKQITDFDKFINYLKLIERCSQYKLYAVATYWEGIKND